MQRTTLMVKKASNDDIRFSTSEKLYELGTSHNLKVLEIIRNHIRLCFPSS